MLEALLPHNKVCLSSILPFVCFSSPGLVYLNRPSMLAPTIHEYRLLVATRDWLPPLPQGGFTGFIGQAIQGSFCCVAGL